jgi:hypothetical protein
MHPRFVLGLTAAVASLVTFSPTGRAGDAEPAPAGDVRPGGRGTGATVPPKPAAPPPKRAVERVLEYADVDLRFADGAIEITAVRRARFAAPTEIPHFRGRYRVAAARGKAPLGATERDFDFPLLADAETDDQSAEAVAIGRAIRRRAQATTTVRVPLLPEADQVVVTDPRTGRSVSRPLPPPPPLAPPTATTASAPAAPPAGAARK